MLLRGDHLPCVLEVLGSSPSTMGKNEIKQSKRATIIESAPLPGYCQGYCARVEANFVELVPSRHLAWQAFLPVVVSPASYQT